MRPWSLRPAFHPLETPGGYASRFASANGLPTIHSLAGFLETRASFISSDRDGALELLARVSESRAADLKKNASRAIDRAKEGASTIRGEVVSRHLVRRSWWAGCAACIEEDLKNGPDWLEPVERAWERVTWRLRPITACDRHGLRLVEAPYPKGVAYNDFTRGLEKLLDHVLGSERILAPFSERQHYLSGRLTGAEHAPNDLLDDLEWHAAARLATLVGYSALYPGQVRRNGILEADIDNTIDDHGFDILKGGRAGFRTWVEEMIEDARVSRDRRFGLQSILGMLGESLDRTDDSFWEPVKDEICAVAFAKLPMSTTGHFLQRHPPKRMVHSIVSAAHEYDISVKSMRHYLRRANVIGPETDGLMPDKVTFPAKALPTRARLLTERLRPGRGGSPGRTLTVTETAAILGIGANYLTGCDFLLAERQNGLWRQFDRKKVLAMRDVMLAGAVSVDAAGPDECRIEEIARRCHVTFAALVGYHDAGRIAWKGRLVGSQSLDGLLFRKAEIDQLQSAMEEGEIALRIAAARVGYGKAVLCRLAQDGHLPARQVTNGRGGRLGWVARQADVEALMSRIMRFSEVAEALSMKKHQAKKALKQAGIEPIFEDAKIRTILFWRPEIGEYVTGQYQPDR
ncbi:hypothetical protein SI859A1_00916 [Aurantimonas manganoxydans SI85-9A1]|uniref:TniQ domain-containing protein n=1 Tax=Aurantimonas manganoxydans (strain ATCC BAA-1229 / DSM 21871 / SI85-9A1) TaxID=287752 RepID=Q1YJT2_AURMS|nr:TniQ family protein [Aurantimonas manganoxydans]EAS50791.1 hypothetical protein SI859A1_00916 [Aurantimonas manganoxydans SI85-9A1]